MIIVYTIYSYSCNFVQKRVKASSSSSSSKQARVKNKRKANEFLDGMEGPFKQFTHEWSYIDLSISYRAQSRAQIEIPSIKN